MTSLLSTGRIGFVHFGGRLGDLLRINAVRQFFDDHTIPYREFAFVHIQPRINILREFLRPKGLWHLSRKVFSHTYPVLSEVSWTVYVREWERDIEAKAALLSGDADDVDVFHAEVVQAAVACSRVKRATGKPFVYDLHGLISEEAKMFGSEEYSRAAKRWEAEAVKNADHVLVVTEIARDYVANVYGVPRERIHLCPNGTYAKPYQASHAQPLHVVYAGNLAPYENVTTFLDTAALAADDDTRFVIIGDGPQRGELFDYIGEKGIDVMYLGRKPYERVFQYLARMQVGFLGQVGGKSVTGHPLKVPDYASCGLPILAGPGPWAEPVQQYNAGIIIERATPELFAAALPHFRDATKWNVMSVNAKRMATEEFLWRKQLAPIQKLYAER